MAASTACGASTSPTDVKQKTVTSLKCYMHVESVKFEKVKILTSLRWDRFTSSSKEWLKFSGRDREIAEHAQRVGLLDLHYEEARERQSDLGFHDTCYRRFVDSKRLNAARKRKLAKNTSAEASVSSPKKLRARSSSGGRSSSSGVLPAQCIICSKVELFVSRHGKRIKDKLAQAETSDGGMLRQAAERKGDENVLIHIRDKDCVALEVRYHASCYKNYTRFLTRKSKDPERSERQGEHQQAYELFCDSVVQQRLIDNQEIMRMSKLAQLFVTLIKKHEGTDVGSYRTDKLKYRLTRDFPQLCFHKPFRRNRCEIVYTASLSAGDVVESRDTSDEGSSTGTSELESETGAPSCSYAVTGQDSMRVLYNAGLTIRNAIKDAPAMSCPWPPRSDDLNLESARGLVPLELFNFMAWCTGATEEPSMITFADVQFDDQVKIMSISQDIVYLASKGRKQTPKSLCLGMTVRHLTGLSQLLRLLNKFGHCSSWDTIIGFETGLAQLQLATSHAVPKGFSEKNPTILVWDNIDFGEETVSGHGTTHHTNGIMIQSCIAEQTTQHVRPKIKKGIRSLTPSIASLETFTRVGRHGPKCVGGSALVDRSLYEPVLTPALQKDFAFLLSKCFNDKARVPGWTGFNINLQGEMTLQKSAIHYLPVIEASPTEMTTVNTIIERSVSIADKLQLRHIVLVFDQAIYAKIQEIRWARDEVMQRTVVRLGELHTCMSFMGVIGKRFGDAGLRDILIESGVVAAGSINGVLSGHQYNRSVHSHKLMFEAMQRLRFTVFLDTLTDEEVEKYSCAVHEHTVIQELVHSEEFADLLSGYDDFIKRNNQESPTFALWSSYIDMVQLLLTFIRATRESDWHLHVAVIRFMMPWFFAYDRPNYSRYLPAYWMEMVSLPSTHPRCYEELSERGEWTVQRQDRYPFASIACDQAIEQTCNRDSKTRGGITGFTLNRGAVQRWILSQPERSAVTRQCEVMSGAECQERKPKELDSARIKRDDEAVESIKSTITSMINPFECYTEELVCLSSGAVANDRVKADLMNALQEGEVDAVDYIKDRLIANKVDMFSTIKQKKLKTFSDNTQSVKKTSKDVIKQNRAFFARLLIVGQKRKIDLREVLSYSLGSVSFPLASVSGSLAKTDKSALLHAIEDKAVNALVREVPSNAAILIDGMAHVQSMRDIPETFGELAEAVLSQVCRLATKYKCSRVDFVADRYPSVSIKNAERARRAEAGTQMVKIYSKDQKTPKQFKKFLSNGLNKEALIDFLFNTWKETELNPRNMTVFTTNGEYCHRLQWKEGVLETSPCSELVCDHEEADTRLLLHARHAALSNSTVIIRSPDTDVAVVSVSLLDSLSCHLFFMTGTGNKSRIIDLQQVGSSLSTPSKCLIGLHAFTGCDSTSAFYGKGKRKALKMLEEHPEFQETFTDLGSEFQLQEGTLSSLEKFVCLLYSQTTESVDDARYKAFCSSPSSEQSLPPTRDALTQHAKRCNYQAAIQRRSLQQQINAPSPDGHGWKMEDGKLTITWMTKPSAPDVLLQCVSCSCKVGKCCKGRCSCLNAELPCTDLCKCTHCSNFREEVDVVDAGEDDLDGEF